MLPRSWEFGSKPQKTAGRMYTAYPNLANVRWLLPAKEPALRRAGIGGLYQPNSLRGRALRTIIGAGAVLGERVWLEEDALARLETMLAPVMGVEAVRLAFYLGVPCPAPEGHRAGARPRRGRRWLTPRSPLRHWPRRRSRTERRALLRLSESAGLQGTVPEVLGSLPWHGGTILLITMGPPRPGPRQAFIGAPAFLHAAFSVL